MKRFAFAAFALLTCLAPTFVMAQTTQSTVIPVTGKKTIDYQTRAQADDKGIPPFGVDDVYKIESLVIGNSVGFQGTVKHLPTIFGSIAGGEKQQSKLTYDLQTLVFNPANPSQSRANGKLVGTVPIDAKGVYQFGAGNLRMAINPMGKAQAFESKFQGTASGKPPVNNSLLKRAKDRVKKQAIELTKIGNGKIAKIVVTDYDIMNFPGTVLAAGPVQAYPETTVTGPFLYDYDRNAWLFNGVAMTYSVDGKQVTDKISAGIQWVKSPQYQSTGEGEYQFDIRVNAPEVSANEAAAFAKSESEADYFAAPDKTTQSLTGTMKYKDTLQGDTVLRSVVTTDLQGNNLTKQQVVALMKLIELVSIVPMNNE